MSDRKPALPLRYIVECDTPADAVTAPGMLQVGQLLPGNILVETLTVVPVQHNSRLWFVDVTYDEAANG